MRNVQRTFLRYTSVIDLLYDCSEQSRTRLLYVLQTEGVCVSRGSRLAEEHAADFYFFFLPFLPALPFLPFLVDPSVGICQGSRTTVHCRRSTASVASRPRR